MARHRMFAAAARERILRAAPGKPSGVTVAVGGLEFDLVALSTSDILTVLELAQKVAGFIDRIKSGSMADAEMMAVIGDDVPRVIDLAKNTLRRSAFWETIGATAEELAAEHQLFEEWFAAIPPIEMLKALVPKVLEANGLGAAINRDPKAPAAGPGVPPEATPSTSSTPLVTS